MAPASGVEQRSEFVFLTSYLYETQFVSQFYFMLAFSCVEILTARSLIVFYLRGPQGQYIWECKYGWMPSARIRVNSHLRPYETSPSPAIRDTSAPAIQDISAPAIRGSSPAETCICNSCAVITCSAAEYWLSAYLLWLIDEMDWL